MGAKINFTFMDYGREKSTMGLYAGDVTAVSIGGFLTQFGALRTATEAITLGTVNKEQWIGDDTLLSNVPPVSAFAQRESKWFVTYRGDTSQKEFHLEIPTADLALLADNEEFLDLTTAGVIADWVTAFEAIARSPESDIETVTVVSIQFVGRNT